MEQYGPLISYDVSGTPVTMTVSTRIVNRVEQIFRENYRLPIEHVAHQGDQVVFTFSETVDGPAFEWHLKAGTPEQYGSV